jgi:hypothetical protein
VADKVRTRTPEKPATSVTNLPPENRRRVVIALWTALLGCILLAASGCSTVGPTASPTVVVNSLQDAEQPPAGTMTLRSAIGQATSGESITFDASLSGATIQLSIVGESHTVLKGEVYSGMDFQGYAERDYGKSALYARKNLTIDASALPGGITLKWTGGDTNRARVLAVYGDLTLKNVTITGGYSSAEAITGGTQPYTLARGGGLAVWGTATLENCTVSGNKVSGDENSSRDRGAYGGGIYANGLILNNCVVSGNSAIGYGAAGGGIYSVGGGDNTNGVGNEATLTACTISGNRVTAQHAYGGGLFTLGGGPNNLAWMRVTNCTIARNLAEDHPGLPEVGQYYDRGGGIYMGGGSLSVVSSTIAENEVTGHPAIFSGKPNMAGGGIAATIGDAHVVENMEVQHSIVAGNKVNGSAHDLFTGSLINFYSHGYNLVGVLDFSQILVPVPDWMNLNRKHYSKAGDRDGVLASDVLALNEVQRHSSITSAGTDAGQLAVLWYPPSGTAVDQIPTNGYSVTFVNAGYTGFGVSTDDFLNHALTQVRTDYGAVLGSDFGTSFGDMTGVTWYGPFRTWPSNSQNAAWITFWRNLDAAIGNRLGTVILGDDFWGTFTAGHLGNNVTINVTREILSVRPVNSDQRGRSRPYGLMSDIGAIEKTP